MTQPFLVLEPGATNLRAAAKIINPHNLSVIGSPYCGSHNEDVTLPTKTALYVVSPAFILDSS